MTGVWDEPESEDNQRVIMLQLKIYPVMQSLQHKELAECREVLRLH